MGKRRIGVSVGCFKDRPTNPRTKMVSSSSSSSDDDHGLALKLQKLPSCNTNMEPLLPPHHHDHGGGPLFCCRSSSNPVSSSSVPDYGLLPATAADVFPVVSKSNHSTEEMSAAAVTSVRESARSTTSFPFTPAQLQELERQTMILNYLMASLPVPPHLIPNMVRNSLELGISTTTTGHSDPEPWRCKRTDGKKWRCSRDVAPDQKYCERHSHKSRPRSRKPVEFHTMTTNPLHRHLNHKPNLQGLTAPSYLPFFPNADAAMPPYEQPRNLEWFLKGETNAVHGWNHLRKDEKDSSQLQCEWLGNDDHYNSWFYNLPKSTSVDAAAVALSQGQETRHFLDAWSTTIRDKSNIIGTDREKGSPVSSADKALPLTLSMYGGGGGSESTETSYEEVEGNGHLGMRNQWLPHCSWPMSSPPGGPLAEALCLGISSDGSKSPPNFTSGMNSSFANKW